MEQEKILPDDAVIDNPQNTDYDFEEFMEFKSQQEEAEGQVQTVWPYDYITLLDQEQSPLCTKYSEYMIINANNILEDIRNVGSVVREQMDPGHKDDGIRKLQDRADNAKKDGYIEGYLSIAKVGNYISDGTKQTKENMLKQIKIAINAGMFIASGANNGDRSAGWNNPVLTRKTSGIGHAFTLLSVDEIYHTTDKLIKFYPNFGTTYGDKGYNYIREDEIDRLFTCYVYLDKNNSDYFQKFKDYKKAQQIEGIAKDLYSTGNAEQKAYWEDIQLTKNLERLYKI